MKTRSVGTQKERQFEQWEQWSNSWNKIIMDEFMKIAMDESLDVFSVNKFCEKFKDEHNLTIAVLRCLRGVGEQAENASQA
ncbi:hypothetical protein B9Z55_007849 [Caenorhabditis nigoni]|uniref:SPK domain-containing protein n=1 Tax=Caenorhabditis nigoni TaxID=1611254 RepID=A0A2G5VBM8_9PELO|nr:hypothetical protein B9Z55_007849 [Caenorhabditis nigoni]